MSGRRYPGYRESGTAWLGQVPEHWDVGRLKFAATYRSSSVDKKTEEDQIAVRLCNYTDVYYNERIQADGEFMEATATPEEVRRFRLRVDDVLITKDSEDWRDIAVPALIESTADDFVCGYHLGVIRPEQDRLHGPYLLRALQSLAVNHQFRIASSGVTRFGLPNSAAGDALIPLPPLDEQRTIAAFLDHETARIDALIEKKQLLLERLEEQRTALISRIVTRGLPPEAARAAGLDPSPRLKPSGVEWLGDVPKHWDTPPLLLRYEIELGKMLDENRISGEHLVPYVRNVDVQWDQINFEDLPEMDIRPHERDRYTICPGDLLVCEGGDVGRAAIVPTGSGPVGFQKALHRLRPRSGEVTRYLFYTLHFASMRGVFLAGGNPNTIIHLTGAMLRRYRFPRPPFEEQQAIVSYLDEVVQRADALQMKVRGAVERLQEYRAALITAAVTGRIDVRESGREGTAAK